MVFNKAIAPEPSQLWFGTNPKGHDGAAADRINARYLIVQDPRLSAFIYRTYVQRAIPERPFPRLENVALGVEEFASKSGLKGKTAESITDSALVRELEQEGFFTQLYPKRPEHGVYGE